LRGRKWRGEAHLGIESRRRKAGRMSSKTIAALGAAGIVVALATRPISLLNAQGSTDGIKEDSAFIHEAAEGGLAEIRLGKLAHDKAVSKDVKQFGQQMETDHSKANQDLEAVATVGGLSVPSRLSPEHQQTYDELSKKTGKDFDTGYMGMMVRDHVDDVRKFQDEEKSARSDPVREFAKKTLPTLEKHLAKARQLAAQVGADTTAAAEHAERSPRSP
jgi:putative membrane protein